MFPINETTELHFLKVYTLIISCFFFLIFLFTFLLRTLIFLCDSQSSSPAFSLYLNPDFFTHIPIEKLTFSPSHLSVLLISKMIYQISTFDIPSFSSSRVVFCFKNCWQSCVCKQFILFHPLTSLNTVCLQIHIFDSLRCVCPQQHS